MKHLITTTSLVAALAISGSALAGSMEDDLHGLCMGDSENTTEGCGCTVSLVKSNMEPEAYTLLHGIATTEEGSEEQSAKITELGATLEQIQAMSETFQSLIGDIETKCNVSINNTGGEGEG